MKFGWVIANWGSLTFTSLTRMMSVVSLAVFSSVVRAVVLRFVLWDTMRRVAADEFCLFIGGYGGIGNGVGFGGDVVVRGVGAGFEPCLSDDSYFHCAFSAVRCVLGVSMSSCYAVRASVNGMDALPALLLGAFSTEVVFRWVYGGADGAGRSVVGGARCVVVAKLLAPTALVDGPGGEELGDFSWFEQDDDLRAFQCVVVVERVEGDHDA